MYAQMDYAELRAQYELLRTALREAQKECPVLDSVAGKHKLRSDKELALFLGISAGFLSRLRSGHAPFTASVILAIHEKAGLPVAEIRQLIAQGQA